MSAQSALRKNFPQQDKLGKKLRLSHLHLSALKNLPTFKT